MTVRPDPYLPNRPPDEDDAWRRFADEDREARFRVGPDFERFNQRDDMFNRAFWDPTVRSADTQAFFASYRMNALPRPADGFTQRDFALRNAAWTIADDYADRGNAEGVREGFQDPLSPRIGVAEERVPVEDVDAATAEVKRLARLFGADLVGITGFDERWLYSFRVDVRNFEEKPNTLPPGLSHVIVLGHGMDHDLVQTYPSALAGAAVGIGYSQEAVTAQQLAQYIRNLGYQAVASMNDTALVIPLAIKAGLGEYGRNQMVITKEFGPRVRFSKIFTDLPLTPDRPVRFGVHEFCNICSRCADACPPKALPYGPPGDPPPNRSAIRGVRKWTADCEKCFGYWAKLKSDCAICMRVCPYNKDFRRRSMRIARWLAGTRLRRLMLWLDGRLGQGRRRRPRDWWAALSPSGPD